MKLSLLILILAFTLSFTLATTMQCKPKAKTTPDTVTILTTDDFDQRVLNESDFPVFVQFWAPWCGWCRKLNPIVDSLATLEQYRGKLKFTRCDTDAQPAMKERYQVRGIPDCRIFYQGQIIKTVKGYRPADKLMPELDKTLDSLSTKAS